MSKHEINVIVGSIERLVAAIDEYARDRLADCNLRERRALTRLQDECIRVEATLAVIE